MDSPSVTRVVELPEAKIQMYPDSLDEPVGAETNGGSYHDVVGRDDPGFGLVEDRLTLAPSLAALPEQELQLLKLRFERGSRKRKSAAVWVFRRCKSLVFFGGYSSACA